MSCAVGRCGWWIVRLSLITVLSCGGGSHSAWGAESEGVAARGGWHDWPQWRGPERNSLDAGVPWPDGLSAERLQLKWRQPLGPSYSGPVVAGERLITTETRDEKEERVSVWNRSTGELLWEATWQGSLSVPFFARSNGSWIRSTPATDGQRLYVAGIRDVLVCFDLATGQEAWRVDFVEQLKSTLPTFGFVSSPLIDGQWLYVQAGGGVAKLNKLDGTIVWRALEDGGGMNGSAFSSPVIATIGGVRQLVVQTRSELAGVDLESGKVLWSQTIESFRGMNILTPTVIGDQIFTSSYGGKSWLYSIKNNPDGFTVSMDWENKLQGYMSSPVVVGDHIYLHLRNQRFACVNWKTGEEAWITKPFGKYWSMVSQGDRMLALDETGDLRLIAADPKEYRLLGEARVSDDSTWAHLSVADGQVFVRALGELRVFEWK